jgi:Zn-dependent M28 family amino/carboxypeptidase
VAGVATAPMDHEALGRAWQADAPHNLLADLAALPERMGGHPGEARAAELVADAFAAAGVRDVETTTFPVRRWDRGSADLAVIDPVERSFETLALPYCPPGDVEADLVDVGYGTPGEIAEADVAESVVVASTTTPADHGRFVHRMEKFGHAAAGGAAGFVFANHEAGQLPPTGSLRFDAEAAVPGVGVSEETGDWLRRYAEDGGRVRLRVDAATRDGESQNVVGDLGPATDEEVVLLAHYDAHDVAEGALDNGAGVATVLGTADVLADADLGCRVRVAAVGCEEVGLLGSGALAERLDLEAVRAVVNVDGAGRARDLRAMTHTSEALADLAADVCEAAGQPVHVEAEPHPYSDHWPFLRRGVPTVQLHSQPPGGDSRGRGWGHTRADTLDKVDPRDLRTHAMLTALLVEELADAEVPRVEDDELREAMVEADLEAGMQAAEIWPEGWETGE